MRVRTARGAAVVVMAGLALGVSGAVAAQDRPIYVRPGAPGEPTVRISPRDIAVPRTPVFTHHEVHFVQHMMPHHGQAVHMSALVPDRAGDERVHTFARRLDLAQQAELYLMTDWLERRDQDVPDPMDWHGHEDMPGMVSHEDMMRLEAAEGVAFDVLFLELMIEHHWGAIEMVDDLMAATGGVVDADISSLAIEIVDVQETEIKRMERMLAELRG